VSFDCSKITAGSGKSIQWRCNLGHVWTAKVLNRTSAGSGCPFCSNKRVLEGFNDLASRFPEVAREAFGWDPTEFTAGSDKKKVWRCSEGHRWTAVIKSRTRASQPSGCPVCSNRVVLVGSNDLEATFPHVAREANGWDPTTVTAGSHSRKQWICKLGHTWTTPVRERTFAKNGCPFCGGKKVLAGFNDLATTHPSVAIEAFEWNPATLTAGSERRRQWVCAIGHTWTASVKSRALNGNGCPFCGGKKVLAGFNDLATTHPSVAIEAFEWNPATLTAGSHKTRSWCCSEGHIWRAPVLNRTAQDPSGCPSCATSGYDPNAPGYFYLLRNDQLGLFQIGITNHPKSRVGKHQRAGWEVIQIQGPMDGQTARDQETTALRILRSNGAQFASKSDFKKFDGWRESWTQSSLQIANISDLKKLIWAE